MAASFWDHGPLVLRTVLALAGTGYIHPDEWHQSGEFAAAVLLPRDGGAQREKMAVAWEFNPVAPARSATTILWSQAPLVAAGHVCAKLGWTLSASHVFWIQRGSFLVLMGIHDLLFARLVSKCGPRVQHGARLLYLTTAASLSVLPRPFSNTLEALLLLAVLVVVQELGRLRQLASGLPARALGTWSARWAWYTFALGVLGATGTFARFTFPLFALPAVVYFLGLVLQVSRLPVSAPRQPASRPSPVSRIASLLLPGVVGGAMSSLVHILLDTWIFHALVPARADGFGGGAWSTPSPEEGRTAYWPPVVAPLNAARYNAKASNLAHHGKHPRWLHAVVNGPIMFGSLTWGIGVCVALVVLARFRARLPDKKPVTYGQHQLEAWRSTVPLLDLLSWTIIIPLLGLSVQPHQEPRFLAPLLAPVCILAAGWIFSTGQSGGASRRWRNFLLLHAVQGITTAMFYSCVHQSGVIPSFRLVNEAAIAVAQGRGAEQNLIWPPTDGLSSPPLNLSPQEAWRTYYAAAEPQGAVDSIDLHVFAWRVYMPPLHLLRPLITAPTARGMEVRVRLHDPPGDDWIDLRPEIEAHLGPGAQHLLIVNGWESMADQAHAIQHRGFMTLLPQPVRRFLHIDTDHFGELWDFWGHRRGWIPPAYVELTRAVIAA